MIKSTENVLLLYRGKAYIMLEKKS